MSQVEGRADIGAHDDANGLGQAHQTSVREGDHH